MAGLRVNKGQMWSPSTWESITGTLPSGPYVEHFKERQKKHEATMKCKAKEDFKVRMRKRKNEMKSKNTSKKARKAYGKDVAEVRPDMNAEELAKECEKFYRTQVKVSNQQRAAITLATTLQSNSATNMWEEERKKRITASRANDIVSRNPNLKVCPLVRKMLYETTPQTEAMRHGIREEKNGIQCYLAYKRDMGYDWAPCGLLIHKDENWLGASPDGLVLKDGKVIGMVEVKHTTKTIIREKDGTVIKHMTFKQLAKEDANFCLELREGQLHLRKAHGYYTQVQVQLEVSGLPWVDLVVRSVSPPDIHIERFMKDEAFMLAAMQKLKAFYNRALLPELAAPRFKAEPGIREPTPKQWVSVIHYQMDIV